MSAGLRKQRVKILELVDTTVNGRVGTGYRVQSSGQADGAWWARVEPVSAREVQLAQQQNHRVDVVISFGDSVGDLTSEAILQHGTDFYRITGKYPVRQLREIKVHAESADAISPDLIVEAAP